MVGSFRETFFAARNLFRLGTNFYHRGR